MNYVELMRVLNKIVADAESSAIDTLTQDSYSPDFAHYTAHRHRIIAFRQMRQAVIDANAAMFKAAESGTDNSTRTLQ